MATDKNTEDDDEDLADGLWQCKNCDGVHTDRYNDCPRSKLQAPSRFEFASGDTFHADSVPCPWCGFVPAMGYPPEPRKPLYRCPVCRAQVGRTLFDGLLLMEAPPDVQRGT